MRLMKKVMNESDYTDSESDSYCSEDSARSGESEGTSVDSIDNILVLRPALCFEKYHTKRTYCICHTFCCVVNHLLTSIVFHCIL